MSPQPVPSTELIARLQEMELGIGVLEAQVQAAISPWYAEIMADAARMVRCVRMEAERLRNLARGEWPDDMGDDGDLEQGGGVLQTAASALEGGD